MVLFVRERSLVVLARRLFLKRNSANNAACPAPPGRRGKMSFDSRISEWLGEHEMRRYFPRENIVVANDNTFPRKIPSMSFPLRSRLSIFRSADCKSFRKKKTIRASPSRKKSRENFFSDSLPPRKCPKYPFSPSYPIFITDKETKTPAKHFRQYASQSSYTSAKDTPSNFASASSKTTCMWRKVKSVNNTWAGQ